MNTTLCNQFFYHYQGRYICFHHATLIDLQSLDYDLSKNTLDNEKKIYVTMYIDIWTKFSVN